MELEEISECPHARKCILYNPNTEFCEKEWNCCGVHLRLTEYDRDYTQDENMKQVQDGRNL